MTTLFDRLASLATLNVGWCLLAAAVLVVLAALLLGDPRQRFRRGRRIRRRERPAAWRFPRTIPDFPDIKTYC